MTDHANTPAGADLIAAERQRQLDREGYDPSHDDEHDRYELTRAAICYAKEAVQSEFGWEPPSDWPWEPEAWKPKERLDDLIRAGALIAAEIDRMLREAR